MAQDKHITKLHKPEKESSKYDKIKITSLTDELYLRSDLWNSANTFRKFSQTANLKFSEKLTIEPKGS